jgi:hypothetical protein
MRTLSIIHPIGGVCACKMACFSKGLSYHTQSIGNRSSPCIGLFKSVAVTLTYLRHNRRQAEIGESFGLPQPAISRRSRQ